MSYILDALKKSEAQRRALQPGEQYSTTPPPEPQPHNNWLAPVLLSSAASLVAAWLLLSPETQTRQPPHTQASQQANTQPVMPPPVQPGKPAEEKLPAEVKQPQEAFKPVAPASPFSRADALFIELPDASEPPQPADSNILAFSELPATVQQSLPAINIEGHIYDEDPQGRMVIINGKAEREKHQISRDLKLEEITPDGVIMNYRGYVFHIGVFE